MANPLTAKLPYFRNFETIFLVCTNFRLACVAREWEVWEVGVVGGVGGGTNSHTGIVWSSHESKKHKLSVQPCPEGLTDTSPALRSISSQFLLFGGLSSPHCLSHDFMGSGNSL